MARHHDPARPPTDPPLLGALPASHTDGGRPPPEVVSRTRAPAPARVPPWVGDYIAHAPRAAAVVTGAGHRVVDANAAFRHLTSFPASPTDDGAGWAGFDRCVTEACPPLGADTVRALLDRVRQTGGPADALMPGAADAYADAWHWTVWAPGARRASSAAVDADLLIVEVVVASPAERVEARQRDLTERILLGALAEQHRTAEAEYREAELAAVFESMPDAVYLGTRDAITRANRPALAQLGVATLDALNAWHVDRTSAILGNHQPPGAEHTGDRRPFARALDGETVVEDVRFRHPATQEERALRCAAAPVVIAGRAVAAVMVTTDVTAQRRLEAQLRESQKLEAVGRLAGGLAHDFNNLLTVIRGNAEVASLALPADSPIRGDLREVTDAVESAAALTRQLLAFSRQQVLRPTTLDLAAVVTELERLLTRALGDAVVLTIRHDAGASAVVADRTQVEQVLMNLAVNARDAMLEGGRCTITTGHVAALPSGVVPAAADAVSAEPAPGLGWVTLRVRDTGHGMDAGTQGRIFEPFFTTKPVGHGAGLGLATVYGIVAQSGGHLAVETAPGAGAAFTLYLPLATAAAAADSAVPPTVTPRRGAATVLLVDDESTVRRAVRRILAQHGFTVLEAASGAEALALAAQHASDQARTGAGTPIRVLITDVMMPDVRGPALAARVRAMIPDLPVLLMSGYAADTLSLGGGLGALGHDPSRVGFLEKPFSSTELVAAIQALLDVAPHVDPLAPVSV